MSDPTNVVAKPHPSLEAAVRYATALEAYNTGTSLFMKKLRDALPDMNFRERTAFATALDKLRYAHFSGEQLRIAGMTNALFTLAIAQGIATDPTSSFYMMVFHANFNADVLADAQRQALKERNPLSV